MIIQQFQEQLMVLSVEERLQIARWLIDTTTFSQKQPSPIPQQDLTKSESSSRQKLDMEIAAFRTLHVQLFESIPEQYAAIHQGKLIDHDADQFVLYMRIQEQYRDASVLIRQVLPKPEREIFVRSPRFEYA